MKLLSHAGLSGALIGVIIGVVEYFIALAMINRFLSRDIGAAEEAREELPGLGALPARLKTIKIMLFVTAVTIYPALGYIIGGMVAS